MKCPIWGCDATVEPGQARCWIHQPAQPTTEETKVSTTIPDLEIETARPEPPRDRWGRYLIRPAAGGKACSYTRATTWAGAIDDKEGLINWSMRMCALGLAARKDLFAQVASCHPDDRDTLKALVEEAKDAGGGSTGANLGKALHRFTQRMDLGEPVTVPDQWAADVAAYHQALADAGLEVLPEYVERIVVLEKLGVAGTFDRIYRTSDKRLVVGDLKTGQSLDFARLSIAVQLALYAHAETLYDWQTETHTPMVDVDQERALVVHVPVGSGTAEVVEFDIAWGWERVKQAGLVRASRSAAKRKGVVSWPYQATRWPDVVPAEPEPLDLSCPACNLDKHICPGCGTSVPHGTVACDDCNERTGKSEPPVDRTAVLRGQLVAQLEQLKIEHPDRAQLLRERWPAGVSGFKGDHDHTVGELRRILDVIEVIEAEARPAEVDEGRRMEAEDVAAIIARVDALSAEQRAVLNGWAKEANAAGVSFNLRLVPSQRRFEIYRACLELAELIDIDLCPEETDGEYPIVDTDLCRATVAAVIPDVAQPTIPIGDALGALTVAEAELLTRVAQAARTESPALQYGPDGAVTWRWPDDANPTSQTEEQDQTA